MTEKIKTISILGPTASGKTGLAIALAKKVGGEVVSCDSMQLYRGMDIGTATPDLAERDGVIHHMFDIVDPEEEFSAADYARIASEVIADIASRGKIPILCGGTGMYHDSLMRISSYAEGERDDSLREKLYAYAAEHGNEALHARLASFDPEAAEGIHPNNVKRVVRAIEVYETTGKTKTETDREQIAGEIPYDDTMFVLTYTDRQRLYARCDLRVDLMMKEGLPEEAYRLLCTGQKISQTAAQAIGYKEFLPYFASSQTLEETAAAIKLATRHYAKRQMIWFRRYPDAVLLIPDEHGDILKTADELADEVIAGMK
ncbi:MAG: tRNA (adenosine(37)-N6)-dimethylallyltransferase MiaA [Clostridia bacterium]|nr:tRNA (adenosine(37)-N6)-dimethylallyltransferase MiaA [Clostridia bacterium]